MTTMLILSAVLIAAMVSGCVQKASDHGIAPHQTPVEFHDPFETCQRWLI